MNASVDVNVACASTQPWTVAEASREIAARRISPVELVEAYLDRIACLDPRLHSYITVTAERARTQAKRAEQEITAGRWKGPLHGIPFGVKDNYHVAGVRTSGGSRLMLDHIADQTSTVIEKLEAQGAILLGKMNTWEYGTGTGEIYEDLPFPLARNAWNLAHFTGGSSTGVGTGVAAGTAMFGLGSDTGGSIRLPAAATGVVGMKATYGLVSRAGCLPNCWSLDVTGPLSWTVEDNAIVLEAIAGFDPRDPQSADMPVASYRRGIGESVKGLTIGIVRDFGSTAPSLATDVSRSFEKAQRVLGEAGARLVELTLPATLEAYRHVTSVINWGESLSIHEADFMERRHLMGRALRDKMTSGFSLRAVDFLAATRMRRQFALATDAVIRTCDAVLLPCTFTTAPPFGDQEKLVAFTMHAATSIFNVSGHPAISIATGFDSGGLPTSAQVVGRYFDEAMVYRVAKVIEDALSDRSRRPAL
jgi:aspartyl-tRNA(Asn)/glutamyl-tRNA(Gln) amidotransferase subunit A